MNLSLESSIRSCKVDPAWSDRLASDRFLNPSNMVCPAWNQHDTAGRPTCLDAYNTKTPGCHSAADRVNVENSLRPQYFEYITLDAQGLSGGSECAPHNVNADVQCHSNAVKAAQQMTGQFGYNTGFGQNIHPNCASCASYSGPNTTVERYQQRKKVANKVNRKKSWMGFF